MSQVDILDELRTELLRLLTTDSATRDRRRKEYNQAIFASEEDGGYAIWSRTSLDMVMDKVDDTIKSIRSRKIG